LLHSVEFFLPAIVDLCRTAGDAILDIYRGSRANNVVYKDDHSPLTTADLESDQILKKGLAALADFPYLSEESADIPYHQRAMWETYWLVDPLDGTKEFLRKTDEFTVNVALIHRGELVLGVVHAPALALTYFGAKKIGSFRQKKNAATEKLPIMQTHDDLKIAMSKSHATDDEMNMIKPWIKGKNISTVSIGSSLKFCLVAEGSAHIYPRSGPTCEWDTAAGHAVLLFSGGEVLDDQTKERLCYQKENLLNNKFVALSYQVNQ